MSRARWIPTLLVLALAYGPALAQYTEDEQTRDHAEEDQRYLERRRPPAESATADEDPAAALAAFLARADELIRDRNHRASESERYRVQTDDLRIDPDPVVALLDRFRSYFDAFWGERAALEPYDEKSRVFLFYSFYKFNQLLAGDYRFNELRPKGHYGSLYDAITLHTDADAAGLADSIVHEATHQLVDRRIFGGRGHPSPWVSEGLATYFGHTYMDGTGTFHPGEIGGKATRLLREGKPESNREAATKLKSVKKALRKARGEHRSPVEHVVSLRNASRFYSGSVLFHYGVSWMIVHYLLHGDDGAHAEAFARYLALEAEGHGGEAALYAELGMSAAELEAAVLDHVGRLKAR